MAKQGGGRSRGQKRAAKVRARRERLAQEETRREQHARLVVERTGDPRFVQRVNNPDGTATVSWETGTSTDQLMRDGFEAQTEAFRRKFGRDPGPEDPVLFDPDADEPTMLTEQRMAEMFDEMIAGVEDRGGDAGFVKAWRDLGYIVTTENQHTFSAADVQAWEDTVAAYTSEEDDELEDLDVINDEDVDFGQLLDLLDAVFREAVIRTLSERSADPAREVAQLVIAGDLALVGDDTDQSEDVPEGALGVSMAFSVLAGWLTGVRERQPDVAMATGAVAWVRIELGDGPADTAAQAKGLLGGESPLGADPTVQQLLDELQEDFLPALTWLAAGAVAQYGNGDIGWFPTLDVTPDDEPGAER